MLTKSSRATWSYTHEKGLVETMQTLVNIPMLRGQNGWTAEGWRHITYKFNEMFPNANFTKQQVQEKEKELKGNYRIIREARKSGFGCDGTLGMINAEPKIWAKLIKDNPEVSKFRKKAFPLFNSLGSLYEGDLNFTSSEPAPQRTQQQVDPTPQRTQQQVDPTPQRTQQQIDPTPQRSISEQSTHNTAPSRNPFNSGLDGIESTEVQSAATNQSSEDVEGVSGKKLKQSQMATGLGDYIEFRKDQIEKTMKELNEKKKHEEDYSVQKCIDIMDAMEELTDEQKADCNELFQSEMNSQIFVGTKNQKGSRPSFGHGGGSAFGSGASSMV